MGVADSQLLEVVTKLIQLTQDDKIHWQTAETKFEGSHKDTKEDIKLGTIYKTDFKGKQLRLYKITQKLDQTSTSPLFKLSMTKESGPYWTSSVRLEFVDSAGRATWTFPESKALLDLLEAASYQTAGVYDFINEILKEPNIFSQLNSDRKPKTK